MSKVYVLGVPLLAHTNGDAAIDMFLKAYASARKGDFSRPWNVTTIHSQFLRKDQATREATDTRPAALFSRSCAGVTDLGNRQ